MSKKLLDLKCNDYSWCGECPLQSICDEMDIDIGLSINKKDKTMREVLREYKETLLEKSLKIDKIFMKDPDYEEE